MKEKKYKIKVENGEIKLLEPLDLSKVKEGIIIFFEIEEAEKKPNETFPKEKKKLNLDWIGCLKEYRDEYTALELQKKAWDWVD